MAGLSLRSLAADVGIATNALYHYFPSRSHLENALSEEAARRLHAALQRAVAKSPAARSNKAAERRSKAAERTARERVAALATGYLRFARREPHLYAAMIQSSCDTGEPQQAHNALWGFVCDVSAALHGTERAASAARSLWALLHGTVSLQQSGALAGKPEDDSITFGLNAWIEAR